MEKSDSDAGGQPRWVAESVKELREQMRCYLSFTDQEVFEGVTPPDGDAHQPVEEGPNLLVKQLHQSSPQRVNCEWRPLRTLAKAEEMP